MMLMMLCQDFENSLLLEMKVRGWDGNESTDHIQWTFTGALFYSIIVITTIGESPTNSDIIMISPRYSICIISK